MDNEVSKLITRGVVAMQLVLIFGLWLLALVANFSVWTLALGIAAFLSFGLYMAVFAKHFRG